MELDCWDRGAATHQWICISDAVQQQPELLEPTQPRSVVTIFSVFTLSQFRSATLRVAVDRQVLGN